MLSIKNDLTSYLIASIFAVTLFTGISIEPLVPPFSDLRLAKEWISLLAVSGFVAFALYRGSLQVRNKWLLAFMVFLLFHIVNAPPFVIGYGQVNLANAWMFKPAFKAALMILFFGAVASFDIDVERILRWLYRLSVVIAVYCILQALNLDQFYMVGGANPQKNTLNAHITGTIGNPTHCAALLAMLFPIAIHQQKWIGAVLLAGVVIFIQSDVAIASLIVGAIVVFAVKNRRSLVITCVGMAFIGIVSLLSFWPQIERRSSGRAIVWRQIVHDITHPPLTQIPDPSFPQPLKDLIEQQNKKTYPLTGIGFGSFATVFNDTHKSQWREAHCEPLQVVYELGIIGAGLLFMVVFSVLFGPWKHVKYAAVTASCLVAVIVNSLGNFPFQIEPHAMITVLLFGIMQKCHK